MSSVRVNVPLGMVSGSPYSSPEYLEYLRQIVQETVLRYAELNPGNGIPKEPEVTQDFGDTIEQWETVAVTALPHGWRNVFKIPVGDGTAVKPCPAILLQELRVECSRAPGEKDYGDEVPCDPPYRTRTVFAAHDSGASLWPAEEDHEYVCTVGPGEE